MLTDVPDRRTPAGRSASPPPTPARVPTASGHLTVVGTVGTSFVVILLQTVQAMLLARILGPVGRGEYATAIFFTTMLFYIGLAGTMLALARRAARHPERVAEMERTSLRLGIMTGTATMGVVLLLALVALPADKRFLAPLCMVCSLALPLEQVRLLLLAVDQGSGRFRRYNAVTIWTAAVLPLLLLVLWGAGTTSVAVVAPMLILTPALGVGFRWLLAERRDWLRPGWPAVGTLLKEGRPFALSVIAADLFGRLDMLLMLLLANLHTQGLYAPAIPAAGLMTVVPTALALFAFNAGARHGPPLGLRKLAALAAGVVLFQAVSGLVLALLLEPMILVVFGRAFQDTVPLALLLVPGQACVGCIFLADGYLRGRNQAYVGVQARLIGAAVMVLGVLALFSQFKEYSIPVAASVGSAASLLWIAQGLVRSARHSSAEAADSQRPLAPPDEPILTPQTPRETLDTVYYGHE